jgi:molecular chaperone DnaK (HSP70)
MNTISNTGSTPANAALNVNSGVSSHKTSKANDKSSMDVEPTANTKQNTAAKDKVSISAEASELLEKEKEKVEAKNENISATDDTKSKSIMEVAEEIKQEIIDDIKKQIEKINEELQKVKGQDDEGSKERAKVLQGQINDLNGQLITIMTRE